jgi:SAM-dependent methyltransferase
VSGWISRTFWSTYRDPDVVKRELARLLEMLQGGARGLNVGSGERTPHAALINVDRRISGITDCIADAQHLPFKADAFELVLSQETVEHVPDPFQAVREMGRVLKGGGRLYLQVPFIIGYHPDPDDFWRFTRAGVRTLIEQAALECEKVQLTFAAGTGLHRVLVEFLATAAGRLIAQAYRPAKGAFAMLFYPLKWLDGLLSSGRERDRIAGGYFGIGRKPS